MRRNRKIAAETFAEASAVVRTSTSDKADLRDSRGRGGSTLIARAMAPSPRHMQVLQALSGAVTLYALFVLDAPYWWWLVALIAYFLTGCIGLSVTIHRAISHRAVVFPRRLEYVFSWLGITGGTGSTIGFSAMHRAHHAHGDSERDPHMPERFRWLILFSVYDYDFNPRAVRDLLRDPVHLFMHRYYAPLLAGWAVALAFVDPLLCIFGFFVPAFAQITFANFANYLSHGVGYRSHDTDDTSTNNWLIAILTWGEGWHNNHHARPSSPFFRERWWEIDPGGIVIDGLRRIGLAKVRPA